MAARHRPPVKTALLALALLGFVTACASKEERRAEYRRSCTELGFKDATESMSNCILQYELRRDHSPHRH